MTTTETVSEAVMSHSHSPQENKVTAREMEGQDMKPPSNNCKNTQWQPYHNAVNLQHPPPPHYKSITHCHDYHQ